MLVSSNQKKQVGYIVEIRNWEYSIISKTEFFYKMNLIKNEMLKYDNILINQTKNKTDIIVNNNEWTFTIETSQKLNYIKTIIYIKKSCITRLNFFNYEGNLNYDDVINLKNMFIQIREKLKISN